ncbi:MAG: molybdopterin converting factor subunit 1 [Gammaproteobacteria bacterium]|nr:molybdopterin converting factor subunit 1 [Gammaproteobacteria bacterium]MDH3465305.1 molybdopterin converting factor subunit 1 [Gammaproteobacteria bacterium]
MAVTIRFFAGLKEQLGVERREVDAAVIKTVSDAWRAVVAHEELPDNILIALNLEYATADRAVRDGDEVAFFPPVTGG